MSFRVDGTIELEYCHGTSADDIAIPFSVGDVVNAFTRFLPGKSVASEVNPDGSFKVFWKPQEAAGGYVMAACQSAINEIARRANQVARFRIRFMADHNELISGLPE